MSARRLARAGVLALVAAALALAAAPPRASAQPALAPPPPPVNGVDVVERLGETIPMDLTFTDHTGAQVRLGDLFLRGKPVVLSLVYFRCPLLCELMLRSVVDAARPLNLRPGADYQVITVSIDPTDRPVDAHEKRARLLEALGGRAAGDRAWPVLVGEEPQIRALADAVGFRYLYDAPSREYAHPAAVFVLSPTGKQTRILYGVGYKARDLKFALIEAGEGRVGNLVEKVLVTCYRYDPTTRRYGAYVFGFMRLGAALILVVVGGGLGVLWWRERRRGRDAA